ncbi:MAG: carboxypeptidase regulatory-like domain-containing protein, partial [Terriglobia bacterium]
MTTKARSKWAFVWIVGILFFGGIESYSQGPAALNGVVSSQEEGRMEGVIVSAKKDGGTITVSVVSDNQGRYTFPGNRLQPGNYTLKTRATGFDLADPGTVRLEANKTAQVDLKLQVTKDIAKQMEPADWFLSNPKIKDQLIDGVKFGQNCIGCHSLYPIMTSKYPANVWPSIFSRMFQYHSASIYEPGEVRVPVKHPHQIVRLKPDGSCCLDDTELAQFIASVNLSSRPDGAWPFELKRMPRPTGRGTRVIITEYEVPRRESQPHDLAVDSDGMVWYNDHGNQYIGRLNPRTGEVKEWLVPGVTAENAAGRSSGRPYFDNNQADTSGRLTFGTVNVNRETLEFTRGLGRIRADGNIWNEVGSPQADGDPLIKEVIRTNPKTGEVKRYPGPDRPMRFYGEEVDSQGNFYGASLQFGVVGILNGKNGEWAFVPTPTPDGGPRRTAMDKQDRFWYAEYYAGAIGMFDPKAWKINEWKLSPYSLPYGIGVDKNGEAWA